MNKKHEENDTKAHHDETAQNRDKEKNIKARGKKTEEQR